MKRVVSVIVGGVCGLAAWGQSAVSDSLYGVAYGLYEAARYAEALPVFERVLDMDRADVPDDTELHSYDEVGIAACFFGMGKVEEAALHEPLWYEFKPVDRRKMKEALRCSRMVSQATTLDDKIKWAERMFEAEKTALGDDSFFVATTCYVLADLELQRGNETAVWAYLACARQIIEHLPPTKVQAYRGMPGAIESHLEDARGHREQADRLAREAWEYLKGGYTQLPIYYVLAMNTLLSGYSRDKDIEGARSITDTAVAELTAIRPEQFTANRNYAVLAQALARYFAANQLPDRGLAMCEMVMPHLAHDPQFYGGMLELRGSLNTQKGNTAQGVADIEECIATLKPLYGSDTYMLANEYFALGNACDFDRQYKKARDAYKTAQSGFKKQGEQGYAGYIGALRSLGAIATRTNDFGEARGYIDECLNFMSEVRTGTPLEEAFLYKERGNCNQGMKETDKALADYRRAMEIFRQEGLPIDDETYFDAALNVYALLMAEDVQSAEAALLMDELDRACPSDNVMHRRLRIKLLRFRASELLECGYGDEALACIDEAMGLADAAEMGDVSNLVLDKCNLLIALYRHEEAQALVRKFGEDMEVRYGKESRQYLQALTMGVSLLAHSGGFGNIEAILTLCTEMRNAALCVFMPGDPGIYTPLVSALYLQSVYEPLKARDHAKTLFNEIRHDWTAVGPDVQAMLYFALANIYSATGDFDKVVECADKLLEIAETVTSMRTAATIYSYAGMNYLKASRLADSEKALLKGKDLIDKGLGANNGMLMQVYSHLNELYSRMGRTALAAQYRDRMAELAVGLGVNNNVNFMMAYQSVWDKYERGLKDECMNDISTIMLAVSQAPVDSNVDNSMGYRLMGQYWLKEGDLKQADSNAGLAVFVLRSSDNLQLAAQVAYAKGDYNMARGYASEGLEAAENYFGRTAMQTVAHHKLMGDASVKLGDISRAEESYRKAFDNGARYIYDNLLTLTAAQRADFWASNYEFFRSYLPSVGRSIGGGERMSGLIYDATLFANGLLLNADKYIARAVQRSGDGALLELYSGLNAAKDMLRRQADMGMEPAKGLSDDVAAKERQLLGALAESGVVDASRLRAPSWSNVRKALPRKAAAVEFLDFNVGPDTCAGMALVVTRDMKQPQLIELYTRHADDDLQTDDLYMSTALGDALWGKIRAVAPDCEEIYFTPQGPLCSIAIEYLPVSEGKLPAMHRLTSTAELTATRRKRTARDGSTLYGGLNYDTSVDSLRADADKYPELKHRGYVPGAALGRFSREGAKTIPYLKGTRAELDSIGTLMARTMRSEPRRYVWNDGTETSFKALSGRYGRVLHIGTHGFFLEGEDEVADPGLTAEDLALQHSGLLLSGAANRYLGREEIPDDMDDGILRASEIADLDLDGVDMTVLSACETGLGRVTADGVFGLQRGFKKAGAGSIMMSLWKVDDAATCRLMTEFYRHWLGDADAGIAPRSKHDALLAARDIVRAQPQWAQPEFWAAFILLDALE